MLDGRVLLNFFSRSFFGYRVVALFHFLLFSKKRKQETLLRLNVTPYKYANRLKRKPRTPFWLYPSFWAASEEQKWGLKKKRERTRPMQQMRALAHWLVEAGRSCGALAAKRRHFLLFVPGDTTPITLSVGADYLWKPFSLTRAGDVSVSRAHSGHYRTSLPHTEARSRTSQSKAWVRRDVTGGFRTASRGVLRQVYFRLFFFLQQLCFL